LRRFLLQAGGLARSWSMVTDFPLAGMEIPAASQQPWLAVRAGDCYRHVTPSCHISPGQGRHPE
jgi:hypothetical protein